MSIYKDEDREEGRAILRALMANDDSAEDPDPEIHMADYHFTERQLDFIRKGYGNTMLFMASYGLKFYNDEDIEEAKAIVDALMDES